METKIFGGIKIKIRKLLKRDLRNAKKFQNFINSLIEKKSLIALNRKIPLKEEKTFLKNKLEKIKKHQEVFILAEHRELVVGTASIYLREYRESHVGEFGIIIRKNYRGMGLGKYLTKEIMRLAKKELKPKPKIIRLGVFSTNKPAIGLYKKIGFKKVARIPHQLEYKGKLMDETIMLLYLL